MAWSSYQASRWNGETTKAIESRQRPAHSMPPGAQGLAQAQTQVDIATFIQWVNATATDASELADFYTARFRPEFKPAFDAWLATDPLTNPDAPPTPFAMDDYQLQARADAERLDADEEAMAATVRRNIQLSQLRLGRRAFRRRPVLRRNERRTARPGTRKVLLATGCLVFVGTAA